MLQHDDNTDTLVVYQISVLQTNRDYFDYIGTDNLPMGARVWVSFRQSTQIGIIVGIQESQIPRSGLKAILSVIDTVPVLTMDMLQLCRWIGQYYQSPLALVLRFALPKLYREGKALETPIELFYELALPLDQIAPLLSNRAAKQKLCVDYLAEHGAKNKNDLSQAGFSGAILQTLVEKNIVLQRAEPLKPLENTQILKAALTLNDEQRQAYTTIMAHSDQFHCFLLQGVTGSGKTEVYFHVIADVLAQGKQVLVLVPEIGLTPQLRQRFQERFAQPLMVIHSQMSDGERQQAWLWAYQEKVQLILGTRSALFTPMPKLGLIIIDEEHDTSLKQMEGVRYFARDAALMRAHFARIPIILGTATPALESLANAEKGKYTRISLTQKALNSVPLHYQIVDLRSQSLLHGLATATYVAIERHLAQNQQVMIFINRRGFSPVMLCHLCGWKANCPHCDACLTVHRSANQLLCHHCGYHQAQMSACPSCQGRELIFMGNGTQRIEEGLATVFPKTNILRVDRDAVRNKHAWDDHLHQIESGQAQLIVGTQMLAKGHHFERLSLVVILDADYGFYDPDFRALERLGQLITQVSGRAGRAEIPGEVVIQTHIPDHPQLNTLVQSGYDLFAQELLEERRAARMPPFAHMALLRVQGKYTEKILQCLHAIKQKFQASGVQLMGPAPAPLSKKGGHHRMQLLFKSDSRQALQTQLTLLREWIESSKLMSGLRWSIDVDPLDLA